MKWVSGSISNLLKPPPTSMNFPDVRNHHHHSHRAMCVDKLGWFTVVVNYLKLAIFRTALTTLTSADHLQTLALAGRSNCSSRVMEWKITTPSLAFQTHESWPVWIYWRARVVSSGKIYGTVTRRQQGLGTAKRNVLSEKIYFLNLVVFLETFVSKVFGPRIHILRKFKLQQKHLHSKRDPWRR